MSFSVTTPDTCPTPDALEDVDKLTLPEGYEHTDETVALFDQAKEAAKGLISSGKVGAVAEDGTSEVAFRTSLSGHCQPELGGGTSLTISITTAAIEAPAEGEAQEPEAEAGGETSGEAEPEPDPA